MMKIEFTSCEDDGQGHFVVQRVITDDDGTEHHGSHCFPYDTLEWRAAEYGIDPSDVDTLLDIVLSEPYLTPEDWSAGHHIYLTDSTVDEARAAHVSRCAKVKLAHRISTRGKAASPLRLVRDNHHMDPEAVDVKRQLVAKGREGQRHARRDRTQEPPPDRVRGLREELHRVNKGQGSR